MPLVSGSLFCVQQGTTVASVWVAGPPGCRAAFLRGHVCLSSSPIRDVSGSGLADGFPGTLPASSVAGSQGHPEPSGWAVGTCQGDQCFLQQGALLLSPSPCGSPLCVGHSATPSSPLHLGWGACLSGHLLSVISQDLPPLCIPRLIFHYGLS